jgi:hypothetical protein
MKIVNIGKVDGVDTLMVRTTPAGNQGLFVKILVPEGDPYWLWPTIPSGQVIAADFTGAPLASMDVAVNNANIAAITEDPADVLTYAP